MNGLPSSAAVTFLLFSRFACSVFGNDALTLSVLKDDIDKPAENTQNLVVQVCGVDPAALLHVTLAGLVSFNSCRKLIEAGPFHMLALAGN